MAKKIYLTIILIITVTVAVIGILYNVFGKNGFLTIGDAEMKSGTITIDDEFSNVEIDVDAADVNVSYGSEFSIDYNMPENLVPEALVKDDTLYIKQKGSNTRISLGMLSRAKYEFDIVLPENTKINDFTSKMDMGNMTIIDVKCENLEINCAMGNVTAKNLESKTFLTECDMGNITVKGENLGDVKATCNMGNIKLVNVTIGKGDMNCDMGNIDFVGEYDDLDAKCDMGNVTVNGEHWKN